MVQIVEKVINQIDKGELDQLLGRLRALDHELDEKIQDVHAAEQQVTVWDRINVFTVSDAEFELQEENKAYRQIRLEHGEVITRLKRLIQDAIEKDFSVVMKIQIGEMHRAVSALKVVHRHGVRSMGRYRIGGLDTLRKELRRLAGLVDEHYGFPADILGTDQLLSLVYEAILRRNGFIQ